MTVPTHNLYDFVHQVLKSQFHLYYFYPWGHKNIENLIDYHNPEIEKEHNYKIARVSNFDLVKKYVPENYIDKINCLRFVPLCIAHDQEPLNFDLYEDKNLDQQIIERTKNDLIISPENFNLRHARPSNFVKHCVLLHSELNSSELEKYEETDLFKGAYWWSHAILSLDWFRFAQCDKSLVPKSDYKKLFLIYARDTTGSRTYRKIFLDKINSSALHHCQIGSFYSTNITSNSSAEYSSFDISNTVFSVILETVFDNRIHLTEKTCRALACGHPFLLANGPGSLRYLKGYGFKTFDPWINESYDEQMDNGKRLTMIVNEINRIANLQENDLKELIFNCNKIAVYNKKIFFSSAFFDKIVNELKNNVKQCLESTKYQLDYQLLWLSLQQGKLFEKDRFYSKENHKKRKFLSSYIRHLKRGGTIDDYEPPF
jgi:hypothetical protein